MKRGTIRIEARFQGPPSSGNGGYVCGRLAGFLGTGAASVRLRVPPPLGRDLEVRRADAAVSLHDADVIVAEAKPSLVALEPPRPPSFEEAEASSRGYPGHESHWFPSCFVCGPERRAGDGLRIFPGPTADGERVAAPWIPDASLASSDGFVAPEFLWAALDCPGAFAFPAPEKGGVLLGELGVALHGAIAPGERCVLVAWQLAHEGRKHRTGTALFGEDGACRGLGHATWIEVREGGAKAGN